MATAGYSGTPLAKKLGIKDNAIIRLIDTPEYYFNLFTDMPVNVRIHNDHETKKDVIHFFVNELAQLLTKLPLLKDELKSNGMIWVSWPKKASKVVTDVTEDKIRSYALSIGLVDIKVCAIDDVWSGLKLVIPVKHR